MMRKLALCALMGAHGYALSAESASGANAKRSSINAIYAQSLVNEVMLAHPELMLLGLHGIRSPGGKEVIIAASVDKIGEPDSTGDNQVRTSGATILEHHVKWGFTYGSVLTPISDVTGKVVGGAAMGFIYTGRPDDWENFLRSAQAIKAELAERIPDAASLLRPVKELKPLLAPDRSIELKNVRGGIGAMVVDQPGHRLLMTSTSGNRVEVASLDTGQLVTEVAMATPGAAAVDPLGGRYWISKGAAESIAVVDSSNLREISTFAVKGAVTEIQMDGHKPRSWVIHGQSLSVMDTVSLVEKATGPLPSRTNHLVYNPSTDRVYVSFPANNEIGIFDPATAKLIARWPTGIVTEPGAMAVDSLRGLLFVVGSNGRMVKMRLADGVVIRAVAVVERAGQIAFDPSSRRIYCAGPDDVTLAQDMAGGGMRLIGSVATGADALQVGVDLRTHAVWSGWTTDGEVRLHSWQLP
jgi:hypothetical protein